VTLLDVLQIVILIYSVVLHELAHGLAARAMGDRTAEHMGRLTLNPFKHLDLFGSFILPLLSRMTLGVMFGYAKPVPYNPYNLSDRRYGAAKVAMAGPMVNLVLAALFALVLRWQGDALTPLAGELIVSAVLINLVLALFNLMPVPPLDGHWLLMTFLPARFNGLKITLYRYQWVVLAICIFFVFPALWPVIAGLFQLLAGMPLEM
jgi:Zn-dependent protease